MLTYRRKDDFEIICNNTYYIKRKETKTNIQIEFVQLYVIM